MKEARSSASEPTLLTDHRAELTAQAQAYLDDLRAATAAAHERLRSGLMRLQPQAPQAPDAQPVPAVQFDDDPIFATREFDVPPQALWKD